MAHIVEILNSFSQGELSVQKIAKQTGAHPDTVRLIARMNPGLINLDGDTITILAQGAQSRTGHNLNHEGRGYTSRIEGPSKKPIYQQRDRGASKNQNGDS